MKILLLAPHPLYQERGTPIAVYMLAKTLAQQGHKIDILAYHEGSCVPQDTNASVYRISAPPFIHGIKPGFSIKKIICDCFMLPKAFKMAKTGNYDIVHAVEESVFMAMMIHKRLKIPYVYDMDSSMPHQIAENSKLLAPLLPVMKFFEKKAVRQAIAVVPVCDALADLAGKYGAAKIAVLRDISLINNSSAPVKNNLRQELGIKGFCFLYLGNLEPYQGIDLLLKSFKILLKENQTAELVIAGGAQSDIEKYQKISRDLEIHDHTRFIGPRPVTEMPSLFEMADALVSPRTKGGNTPMKIYSYLDSGKPIIATNLATHTQVLDNNTAVLTPPCPQDFAQGMARLINDSALRLSLAQNAKKTALEKYSSETYAKTLSNLYKWIETKIHH